MSEAWKRRLTTTVLSGIFLSMLLWSFHLMVTETLQLPVVSRRYREVLLGTCFSFSVLWNCCKKRWQRVAGFLGFALVVVLYCAKNRKVCLDGAKVLYTYVIRQIRIYYRITEWGKGSIDNPMHGIYLLFLIEVILLCYMSWNYCRRKQSLAAVIPELVLVAGVLLLGKNPSLSAMAFLIVGLLGMQIAGRDPMGWRHRHFLEAHHQSWQHLTTYLCAMLVVSACLTGAYYCTSWTQEKILGRMEQMLQVQHRVENRVVGQMEEISTRVQRRFSGQANGIMTNTAPKYRNIPVMEVTTQEYPQSSIYLRGFTGLTYKNGIWSDDLAKTFDKEIKSHTIEYLLKSQGADGLASSFEPICNNVKDVMGDLELSSSGVDIDTNSVLNSYNLNRIYLAIQYTQKNKYKYMPYYQDLSWEMTDGMSLYGDAGYIQNPFL